MPQVKPTQTGSKRGESNWDSPPPSMAAVSTADQSCERPSVYPARALDASRRRGETVPDALLAHIAPLG